MRNIFLFLVLFISCKSSNSLKNEKKLSVFKVENYEGDKILLSKKAAILKNHGEIEKEIAYTLKVPTTLKKIKSVITVIPNRTEILFNKNQKVLIMGNINSINIDKTNLTKEVFLLELQKNYLEDCLFDQEVFENRFFGIISNEIYILMYLNVDKKNLHLFNEVLQSQNLGNVP